jgi:hypothetical protein
MNEMGFFKVKDFFENLEFQVDVQHKQSHNGKVDMVITLNNETVYTEIKKEVRPQHVHIYKALSEYQRPLLVVADYITPKSKEVFKQLKSIY